VTATESGRFALFISLEVLVTQDRLNGENLQGILGQLFIIPEAPGPRGNNSGRERGKYFLPPADFLGPGPGGYI
jgi:hypothetical protein